MSVPERTEVQGVLPRKAPQGRHEKARYRISQQMKKPDLVFLTPHNQEALKKRIIRFCLRRKAKAIQPKCIEEDDDGPQVPA